jgi:hypothetical protein
MTQQNSPIPPSFDENAIASFADLVHLLERDGVFHQVDVDESTVQIATQRGSLDSVLIIRWQEVDGVVQFIQAVPLEVPASRLAAVVDAVTRLNHVLAIPGFDVNHDRRMLAYRLYLPIYPRGAVRAAEIQAMFRLTVKTAADLMPVLARVIAGETHPEGVVADAQREYAAQNPPPPAPPPPQTQTPAKDMY